MAEYNAIIEENTKHMGKNHPRRGALLVLMLFLFIGMAAYGEDCPMRVGIRVTQSTVNNNGEFLVSTTIRNVSRDEQSLEVWSCSYPQQWTANNPAVHITSVACKKNDVIRVRLKPGEAYERTLSIHIGVAAEHRAQNSVAFRLGFEPVTSEGTGSHIWSNVITVNVTE